MKKIVLLIAAIFVMANFVSCVTAPQGGMQPQQQGGVIFQDQPIGPQGPMIGHTGGGVHHGGGHHQQGVQRVDDSHLGGRLMPDGRRLLGYATRTHTVTMDNGTVHRFNDAELREFQRTHGSPNSTNVTYDDSEPWTMGPDGMIYAPGDLQGQNGPPQMVPQHGRSSRSLHPAPSR